MRAYITGMAGFLGSHLADHLFEAGHDVHGCDDFSTGSQENLSKNNIFCDHEDITELDIVSHLTHKLKDVDILYHCAAAAYEGFSVFSPGFISTNVYAGSANVFSAAISAGVKRIVYCSSMSRYGIGLPPFKEDQACNPVDPYGLAKYTAEHLLKMLSDVHGFEYVIAVPHNIYGPRQKYDDPYRNVPSIMANRILRGEQPIIYGDGSQVRCFSYVDDVVPCLAKLGLIKLSQFDERVFNLGPDTGDVSINQLAQTLCEVIGVPFDPLYMPARPQEVKHATCSAERARRLLGYTSKTSLKEGLALLVQAINNKGTKSFQYHMSLEITKGAPKTWTDRLI